MRHQLLKLRKGRSTKSERKIGEILKRNRIRFKVGWRIGRYQVDFLVNDKIVIEVDGSVHRHTNSKKDIFLFSKGYVPLHIRTDNCEKDELEQEILYLIKANS